MQKLINFKRTISLILVGLLSLSFNVSAHKSSFQTANSTDQKSAGTLVRTKNSVDARLALTGLDADAAYTVWWIVFNNPENCINGIGACGPADNPSVFYAAGFVTGNDGSANVSVHMNAGKLPVGLQVLAPGELRKGNGFKAELHMVVRSHGSIILDMVAGQIGTVGGSCDVNTCVDQFAIIFPPAGH